MSEPIIMYGKPVADKIKQEVRSFLDFTNYTPELAIVSIGNDPASEVYMRNKLKAAEECGIKAIKLALPDDLQMYEYIEILNKASRNYNAAILQLPLPEHLRSFEHLLTNTINAQVDVDCLTDTNIGILHSNSNMLSYAPCTPAAIIDILRYYDIKIAGKNVVVIGRSNIVGRPVAEMLLQKNATVTICHTKTKDLKQHTLNADILICAAGCKNLITADMVKEGVVIVDVSINRDENGLCGDVDFENVAPKCYAITPVPKGVGPVTVAELMNNVSMTRDKA